MFLEPNFNMCVGGLLFKNSKLQNFCLTPLAQHFGGPGVSEKPWIKNLLVKKVLGFQFYTESILCPKPKTFSLPHNRGGGPLKASDLRLQVA
jgi:hypothetical protein